MESTNNTGDKKQKISCSVSILTLNSAKHLEKCLNSIKDFDDVFILDGNSTDETLYIAKKREIAVYKQTDTDEPNVKISNFAMMRDKAVNLCKHDWVLILDSDEYLSTELIEEIRQTLESEPNTKTAFAILNLQIINGRIIRHSFNEHRYIRLYNKQGGIKWNLKKAVHEKFDIPADIKTVNLNNCFYNIIPSFKECIAKDNFYLSLVRNKKTLNKNFKASRSKIMISILMNIARAIYIIFKGLMIYVKHGFAQSLPPKQVWRYVRYHLIISYIRLKQLKK